MPAPTKPTLSPSMSGMSVPGKRSLNPPAARQAPPAVETTKLDPSELGIGPPPGPRKSREQELLENAEPINTAPPPPAQTPAPQPTPAAPPVRKVEKDALTTLVSTKLVDQLAQEYGFDPVELHTVELKFKNKVMKVEFRAPVYDDYLWALAVLQQSLQGNDDSYLQTEVQRQQFYTGIISCRCVQKINGQWVWDIFEVKDQIAAVSPTWGGQSFIGVPDFLVATMAKMVFELFRTKLHYQFMYDLTDAVQALENDEKSKEIDEEDEEDQKENPT